MEERKGLTQEEVKVSYGGYIGLVFAIIFFSGLVVSIKDASWLSAFDFTTITGSFGTMKEPAKNTFMGAGGKGAREGFIFGFYLIPAVMLALGIIEILDQLGALRAAQKLLSPILRPVMGVPGAAGLALITTLQSTDAGAILTKQMYDTGMANEKERIIMTGWQFSAAGIISNYFASGSALFSFLTVPIIVPLVVVFIMKFVGANIIRLALASFYKEDFTNDSTHST